MFIRLQEFSSERLQEASYNWCRVYDCYTNVMLTDDKVMIHVKGSTF